MPGVLSIAMISVRTTNPLPKKFRARAPGHPFRKFFVIHHRKKSYAVKFNFRIGHFSVFINNKQEIEDNPSMYPRPTPEI